MQPAAEKHLVQWRLCPLVHLLVSNQKAGGRRQEAEAEKQGAIAGSAVTAVNAGIKNQHQRPTMREVIRCFRVHPRGRNFYFAASETDAGVKGGFASTSATSSAVKYCLTISRYIGRE